MPERSKIGIVFSLVALLVALAFIVSLFGIGMWGPMMGGWYYRFGMRWGGLMFAGRLLPLLFIVLVATGAYLWLSSWRESAEGKTAIAILNERYARGEITKEQFFEMKQHLTKK